SNGTDHRVCRSRFRRDHTRLDTVGSAFRSREFAHGFQHFMWQVFPEGGQPSEDFLMADLLLNPGQRVRHAEHGDGVVVVAPSNGFVRVFFGAGERQVPVSALTPALGRTEQIVQNAAAGEKRARRAWLAYQAHALPLLESASALTSAKIDLLPHQVVL